MPRTSKEGDPWHWLNNLNPLNWFSNTTVKYVEIEKEVPINEQSESSILGTLSSTGSSVGGFASLLPLLLILVMFMKKDKTSDDQIIDLRDDGGD